MNPEEIEFRLRNIRKAKEQRVTTLLVEHNTQILELCDRVVVISFEQQNL